MRHSPPARTLAIGVALLALLVANLLPIRTDLAALAAEAPAEPGIYAESSEHAGHTGWHHCTDPACLVCNAPHAWLTTAPPVMPAVMPLAPEIPAPSLYEETRLPWPQAPPARLIALGLQPRAPPSLG